MVNKKWENVQTITLQTRTHVRKAGIHLGIGKHRIGRVAFIPPDDARSIRVEGMGRYEASFMRVDKDIHGVFTFIPENLMTCEIKERSGILTLECKE